MSDNIPVKENLPKHVAVIMDGNGRWAKKKGKNRVYGHKNGVASVRQIVEASGELEIDYLTLYAFSTENWQRPKPEVDALMTLLVTAIKNETKKLHKNNVRFKIIGNVSDLPKKVRKNLEETIEVTKNNTGLTLILALSYSFKWEMTRAVKAIVENNPGTENIDADLISNQLTTAEFPDPELLIRTGGEKRISNFLLWQLAYSELYFTEVLWPDFDKSQYYEALKDFQTRERRFGKTGDQIKSAK
ncbi:MAG: isoprenyl transferase [Bacteroidota bacterium]|nr:isoprenyl transferase [Bacteroidota bacterium]